MLYHNAPVFYIFQNHKKLLTVNILFIYYLLLYIVIIFKP